ncbi:hypothetical protein VTI74DRAFT_11229 [Chaetomium olivicolor]
MRVAEPSSKDAGVDHLRFRPDCGLCCNAVGNSDEKIVARESCSQPPCMEYIASVHADARFLGIDAVLGEPNSCTFLRWWNIPKTRLDFPRNVPALSFKPQRICQYCNCKACPLSPDAVFVHAACLQVFRRQWRPKGHSNAEMMDRLYLTTAWSYPWKYAPALRLSPPHVLLQVPSSVAVGLGLPQLATLPLEIVERIRSHSAGSPLWRYLFLTAYGSEFAEIQPSPFVSVPLNEVSSWKRGEALVRVLPSEPSGIRNSSAPSESSETYESEGSESEAHGSSAEQSVVRVTIDWRGIREIERLEEAPRHRTHHPSDDLAFAVLKGDQVDKTSVHFKDGFARLKNRQVRGTWKRWSPDIWDTPTPPDLERECFLLPSLLHHLMPSVRWGAAQLDSDKITGITFFSVDDRIAAVHFHTSASPTATPVFEHLEHPNVNAEAATDGSWLYMPIAPGDRILEFGVRLLPDGYTLGMPEVPCFLVSLATRT